MTHFGARVPVQAQVTRWLKSAGEGTLRDLLPASQQPLSSHCCIKPRSTGFAPMSELLDGALQFAAAKETSLSATEWISLSGHVYSSANAGGSARINILPVRLVATVGFSPEGASGASRMRPSQEHSCGDAACLIVGRRFIGRPCETRIGFAIALTCRKPRPTPRPDRALRSRPEPPIARPVLRHPRHQAWSSMGPCHRLCGSRRGIRGH
jgi:hypothetical protein